MKLFLLHLRFVKFDQKILEDNVTTMETNTLHDPFRHNLLSYNDITLTFCHCRQISRKVYITRLLPLKINSKMSKSEIFIPVPWGHIAALTYGESTNPPILLIHGLLDNAAAYKALITMLPQCFFYVCVDLPGHGRSSHLKGNLMYSAFDFVLGLKIAVDFLEWEKFIVIGHSMGGFIAARFLQLFPMKFEKLVLIDAAFHKSMTVEMYSNEFKYALEGILKLYDTKKKAYTYEEALNIVKNNRFDKCVLSVKAANMLLERSLLPIGRNKYMFSSDRRVRYVTHMPCNNDYGRAFVESLGNPCPILLFACTENGGFSDSIRPVIETWKRKPCCQLKWVKSTHDVLTVDPELLAPSISEFLLEAKHKL